jgi:(heptosyl)LPS beta-1,4-glucosyltransferase
MHRLIAIVLTYNESEHITDCLEALRFADARLVFDSGSTDNTQALAKQAGAEVMVRPFDNYTGQRNAALEAVKDRAEWVLFVDADERVSPALAAEIQQAMTHPEIAGWQIPRHNYLFGVLTRGAGWYPDYQTRLLRVGSAHYDRSRQVHEVVLLDGPLGTLKEPFIHYNYKDLSQFRAKQNKYVQYDAQMLYEQGVKPKFYTYFTQPLRHFWWRFVALKGYRDGWHGFRLSALMAWYEMRKYWVLRRLRRERA